MSFAVNGTTGITFNDNTNMATAASLGPRNRIINGNMAIDQRNNGASGTAVNAYTVDRWYYNATQSSKGTWQQNAGSVTPPAGFTNYLGFTSSSSYSVTSTDIFGIQQYIEGFNVADLAWGTANAKTITLSFWVYSSLTGTFGGAIKYYGASVTYPFSYTISSANTWTQISVTIAGNTSNALPSTTSGGALIINFALGAGSSQSGTAGSWQSASYLSTSGAVSVVGTSGATFYVTGVQFEVGSVATPYQFNTYSDQLAQCQRYYQKSYIQGTVPGSSVTSGAGGVLFTTSSGASVIVGGPTSFPVTMRTSPTLTVYDNAGTSGKVSILYSGSWSNGVTPSNTIVLNQDRVFVNILGSVQNMSFDYTVSAEL